MVWNTAKMGRCLSLVPDQDASLPGVAAVILDEFHERGWDADLALTLCIDSQRCTCPGLRLVFLQVVSSSMLG